MVEQGGEPGVPPVVADGALPGQALHALGEVPVGEDVRQAEGGEVQLGELLQVDPLGGVAVGAEVEQHANLAHAKVEVGKLVLEIKIKTKNRNY